MRRDYELERMLGEPRMAIRSLAYALFFSYLVIQLNSFVDTFWTSGLGDKDMTAVSVMSPVYWIVTSAGIGLGVGAASTMAFHLGERDYERAGVLAENSLALGLLVSIIVSISMSLLVGPLINLMGADDVYEGSLAYVRLFLIFSPTLILDGIVAGMLRSEGAGHKAMALLVISAGINMVLDPLLIYDVEMGVAGAGWATAIGTVVSTSLGLYWYLAGRMRVRVSFRGFRPDRSAMKEVFGIGGPRTAEALATGFTNIFQRVFIIIAAGSVGVMLYNVPWRYPMLAIVPAEALGAAMIPVCSAALGQRDVGKMKEGMLYAGRLSFVVTAVLAILIFVFAESLMGVFTTSDTMADHHEKLVWVLRMLCIFIPFDAMRKVGSSMLQVLRRSTLSTVATLIWGAAKLGAYAVACTCSFDAIIIACVAVYIAGGTGMVGLSYLVARNVREENMPAVPRTTRRGPESRYRMLPGPVDLRMVLRTGFEPGSRPRKGRMIGRYTNGAQERPMDGSFKKLRASDII